MYKTIHIFLVNKSSGPFDSWTGGNGCLKPYKIWDTTPKIWVTRAYAQNVLGIPQMKPDNSRRKYKFWDAQAGHLKGGTQDHCFDKIGTHRWALIMLFTTILHGICSTPKEYHVTSVEFMRVPEGLLEGVISDDSHGFFRTFDMKIIDNTIQP